MPNTNLCDKNQKITNFTTRINKNPSKNSQKRPISPSSTLSNERVSKQQITESNFNLPTTSPEKSASDNLHSLDGVEENTILKQALGPLITKFRLLRESVNTVHQDYADLKHTISKQKEELKQDLSDKIDKNTTQLIEVSNENKILQKENEDLKTRLNHIEQNQLSNNFIITGIPEGPYEQYSTMKLRVQEMIVVTIDSGDTDTDLDKAKGIEITSCTQLGRFRHNTSRPISVTFSTRDDKESFLSCKRKLPTGIFANEELPPHIKRRRDRLMPVY